MPIIRDSNKPLAYSGQTTTENTGDSYQEKTIVENNNPEKINFENLQNNKQYVQVSGNNAKGDFATN